MKKVHTTFGFTYIKIIRIIKTTQHSGYTSITKLKKLYIYKSDQIKVIKTTQHSGYTSITKQNKPKKIYKPHICCDR